MIATIHQPQFLPWLGYFDKADQSDVFILLDNVQFKKNDWQNRNKIRTSQGWQWLTVPVIHSFGQTINAVKINNKTNWKKAHRHALEFNYKNAPFYTEYINFFDSIYNSEWEYLSDLNTKLIKKIIEWLGIKCKIILSSEFQVTEDSTERLIDLCQQVHADTYLSGIDGSNYLDFKRFEERGLKVRTQNYGHPHYDQLWMRKKNAGFLSHMSIVDLLFNEGPRSLQILRQRRGAQ